MDFSFCDFIAGWNGGICGILIGHPADTVKVRQQVLSNEGILKIISLTYKHEKMRGFYKGMAFPIISAGVLNAIFFGIYGNTMRLFDNIEKQAGTENNAFRKLKVFIAGTSAGFVHTLVSCPVEVVKIRLQSKTGLQSAWKSNFEIKYSGVIGCVKGIYSDLGIKGFYRGLPCTLWRDSLSFGVYMSVYTEMIAQSLQPKSVSTILLAGGLSGVVSWLSIVPLDVVKSRLQADNPENPKYRGTVDCFIKSYQSDGLKIFGRGFWMIALRAFPVNSVTFLAYEWSLNLCQLGASLVDKKLKSDY